MSTETEHFDFAVLGGGSAGFAAARTAHELGLKTVVIDGADELSGLCILRGCMPSKSLIESANRNLTIRHAAEFGLSAKQGDADTRAIRDRKRRLIREFAEYRQGQLEDGRFTLMRGYGRFTKTNNAVLHLAVDMKDGTTQAITAGYALISTGSVVNVPVLRGLNEAGFWTSDTLLDAPEIPDSFVVLGGGPIALEMAHYLDGIGRKVTVLQRNTQLLTGMDVDLADVVQEAYSRRGMKVICGTTLKEVSGAAELKRVHFQYTSEAARPDAPTHHVDAAEILVALGRRPAVDKLGLAAAGVAHANNGLVEAHDTQQTTHPRIFAAGDVCGPLEVVHLAIQQGEVAAKNVAALRDGKEATHRMDYRCKLFGVFSHPQVASVGLSECEAKVRGVPYRVASYPFNDHGKSLIMGEIDGFVKLIAHAETGELLGGSVVGPEATELIHEIAVAMHFGATAAALASAPHYHPTLSEIWTYPAEELRGLYPPSPDANHN
jgi:pyruvate/2-oxoglutarate dehydrogenase complex dihydrolipoamide dehydrogenase (E3) component